MVRNLYFGTPTINLLDIPLSKFNISLPKDVLNQITKNLNLNKNLLYKKISRLNSQKNIKISTIKRNFLCKWQNGERIPIDCFLLFCKLSRKNALTYQKYITDLFLPHSKNSWKTKFPIKLDKNYFIISEAIRTEGCLIKGKNKNMVQGLAIPNKDIFLLNMIENLLTKLNINKKSVNRILNVVLYFDNDPEIEEIIDLNSNRKMHFHYNNQRLFILDSVPDYNLKNKYKVNLKNNQSYIIHVYVDKNNLVTVKSNTNSTGYITLQVYNSVFAKFLHYIFNIDYGIGNKKTYNIDFPFRINNIPENILKSIVNTVICCEGHIRHKHRRDRAIIIKIASKEYLKKIQNILLRLGINSTIWKKTTGGLFVLRIGRRKNLVNIDKNMKLYVKYKKIKLKGIVNSYLKNRFTHYEACGNYLDMIHKYGPIDLKKLSNLTKKNYGTLMGALRRLEKQGFLKKYGKKYNGSKGTTPWIYSLSDKGKDYLKIN